MATVHRNSGATALILLCTLMGAGSAAAGKLSVLYQATAEDGNAGGTFSQTLPVAGGGVIVEATGGEAGLVLLLTPNGTGQPYTRTVVHEFTDGCSTDGGNPSGHLVADKAGNVWGMTNASCGVPGGTVFELIKPVQGGSWTYNEILQMPAAYTGGGYDDIVFDTRGNLYGLLRAACVSACSTIFEIPAAALAGGNEPVQTLYSFGEAAVPKGLVRDKHGNLFGAQPSGGSTGLGAVWEVSPPARKGGSWTGGVIHNFCTVPAGQFCTDGLQAEGAPAVDINGALYGTSMGDGSGDPSCTGADSAGVIWVMQPPVQGGSWSLSVIHDLCSGNSNNTETADYLILDPVGDTLLSPKGQVITEVGTGGWIGTKKNQIAVSGGGVLSVSPETQADKLVSKAFAAYGAQAGPLGFNSSLSMDSKGNLYGSSQEYYDPNANPQTTAAVIFEITN